MSFTTIRWPWVEVEQRRVRFCQKREGILVDDQSFAKGIFSTPSPREEVLAAIVRAIIGRLCGVRTSIIDCNDDLGELEQLMGSGRFLGWLLNTNHCQYDSSSMHWCLESELRRLSGQRVVLRRANVKALDSFSRNPTSRLEARTLGQWTRGVVQEVLAELTRQGIHIDPTRRSLDVGHAGDAPPSP
jgi:hypothetical protein